MNRGDQVTYRDYLTRETRPGRITMITRTPPVIIQVQDTELGNHLWLMTHEINPEAEPAEKPQPKQKGGGMFEIPHCKVCEVFMTLKTRRKPSRGFICPTCGAETEPDRPEQLQLFGKGESDGNQPEA